MTAQPVEGPGRRGAQDARTVRDALSPHDAGLFDAEYAAALQSAQPPVYDVTGLLAVVERWRRYVALQEGHAAALEVAERELAGLDVPGAVPVSLDMLRSA